VDGGATLGRVDAVTVTGGRTLIAWLESLGTTEAEWRVRLAGPDGRLGASQPVIRVDRARLAGFPRLAWTGTEALLGVTVTAADGGVRVLRLSLPPSPAR
jgi:hypothetical protein